MITEEQLRELSKRFKIDTFTMLREYIQIVFLKNLYNYNESNNIYFKGGTAIHFFLGSFRFSEDLDFSTTISGKTLLNLLVKIVKDQQLEIPEIKLNQIQQKRNSLTARLNYYVEKINYPATVKLEFSLREKPLTKKISILETKYPITPYPLVVHLDWEEILAEKVRAILIRAKGRDIFDLWFLLSKNINFNQEYINKKLRWYKKIFSYTEFIKKLKGMDPGTIESDLRQFLPSTHRKITKNLVALALEKLDIKKSQ